MKAAPSYSLTARVTWIFAIVVLGTFLAVGSYLYRSLAHQLERRDDSELIGKIALTRHLLEDVRSIADLERKPDALLNAMLGHEGLLFLVLAPDGRVLVQNTTIAGALPPLAVVPARRAPVDADVRVWNGDRTRRRAVAARGALGDGEQVIIVVARDVSERAALLRTYGIDLALAALFGTLVASLLGYVTVRGALRAIGAVARKANEITSLRLDTRLDVERAPAELRELTAAFNAMLDRLEDGMKRLSRFAADLAHDLRTPVNALMVNTQVGLSRPRTAEEYRALLEASIEEYERLSRLIESTLFLARAENEQLAVAKQPLDARRVLDKVAEYFSGVAEEAGVTLRVAGQGSLVADPVLVERALSNLVANAVRHTPRGGTILIASTPEDGTLALAVTNPGLSIPEEQISHVFDRYYRGDPARTQGSGSTGLGLAIVRAIMTLHGGTASVDRSPDGLTRFTLRFPGASVFAAEASARKALTPATS